MSGQDLPAQNLDAEERVLGAILTAGALGLDQGRRTVETIAATGIRPEEFYRPSHGTLYRAACKLAETGKPVDAVSVAAELDNAGTLEDVGGKTRVHELAALCPAVSNAAHYAALIREEAERREEFAVGRAIADASRNGGFASDPDLAIRVRAMVDRGRQTASGDRLTDGRTFAFERPTEGAIWGGLWVAGEGAMLCAPQGVGKTTLAQRVALARAGILTHVLGLPVARTSSRVLYVAADRPNQAARSLARMVDEKRDGDTLAERLSFWRGPLPFDVLKDPERLAGWTLTHGADTLIIDTLSAVAPDLARDETGSRLNLAFQSVVSSGVELLVNHHQRKAQAQNPKPKALDDVYGSVFLTAGLGSVVLLWGKAGDPVVELAHLKQPAEEVGPFKVTIDHETGAVAVTEAKSLADLLRDTPAGVSAKAAAAELTGSTDPTDADIEKARRRLSKLEEDGAAARVGGTNPTLWVAQ